MSLIKFQQLNILPEYEDIMLNLKSFNFESVTLEIANKIIELNPDNPALQKAKNILLFVTNEQQFIHVRGQVAKLILNATNTVVPAVLDVQQRIFGELQSVANKLKVWYYDFKVVAQPYPENFSEMYTQVTLLLKNYIDVELNDVNKDLFNSIKLLLTQVA